MITMAEMRIDTVPPEFSKKQMLIKNRIAKSNLFLYNNRQGVWFANCVNDAPESYIGISKGNKSICFI